MKNIEKIAFFAKRLDITIYSERTRKIIIIELTVLMKEKLSNAYGRKKYKYQNLVAECKKVQAACYFTTEVGGIQRL